MGRYIGPVCKQCRREGDRLFLKGNRCITDKCTVSKKRVPPGGLPKQRRPKLSDYGLQLRAKQKLRRHYMLLEKQFHLTFEKADQKIGKTGDQLILFLELRLDNLVYKLNLASSRAMARQIISHGHIEVNGRKVNIPSYTCKEGDVIEVKEKSKKKRMILESLKNVSKNGVPDWLEIDVDNAKGKLSRYPSRQEVQLPITEEQLQQVVEFYSK